LDIDHAQIDNSYDEAGMCIKMASAENYKKKAGQSPACIKVKVLF